MSFFRSLRSSVYDPAFYREVAKQRFSETLGFFLKYILLLSGVSSLVAVCFFAVFLYGGALNMLASGAKSWYPEELTVTVSQGAVLTNQTQPYAIPMPFGYVSEKYDHLIVFDTEYPVTLDAVKEFKTIVLVGEQSVGVSTNRGELRVIGIPGNANFVIDRAWVEDGVTVVSEHIKRYGLFVAIAVLPMVLFFGFFVGTMVYLLFAALLIWLVASMKKLPYTYGQAYCIGMYLIVLPQAVSTLFSWITMFIPFFRTIVLTVLAVGNLEPEKTAPEKVETT